MLPACREKPADLILEVYRRVIKKYGAENVAVIGDSYGGLLAMQLLTRINRNNAYEGNAHIEMPDLLIMNSPFGYPKTEEEWNLAQELEKIDVMLPNGAFRYMLDLIKKTAPDTPDYALYPVDMDFHNAPETYIFYAEEACAAVPIKIVVEKFGYKEQESGRIACYQKI